MSNITHPAPPRLIKELEFKIVKEDWFIYRLKDGSILKVKPVLIKVFETDQVDPAGKKIYATLGQNIVTVTSPENLKGTPTLPLPPPNEALKLDKEEVEVEHAIYDPRWNIYELENGEKLKVKIVITHVYKIKGKYDEFGNPYYVVQSVTVVGSSLERAADFRISEPDIYKYILLPNFSPQCTQNQSSIQYGPSLTTYYKWTSPQELRLPETKFREIPIEDLIKYLTVDEAVVKEELKSLLKSYEIPEEYASRVEVMIRDYIKGELERRGLPVKDEFVEPLYKLFIHIAYVMLYV
jgi:hypothetical protein